MSGDKDQKGKETPFMEMSGDNGQKGKDLLKRKCRVTMTEKEAYKSNNL